MRQPKPQPKLPAPCINCRPHDGSWRRDPYTGSMERCDCARGKAILAMIEGRKRHRRAAPKAAFDGRMAATGESE